MSSRWILDAARDFRLGSSMLSRHFGERLFPLRSTVVPLAFSIELYLKYLSAASSGVATKGHDLAKLYAALPQPTRELIERHYAFSKPIGAVLEDSKSVFIDWRYIYEKQSGAFQLDVEALEALSAALDRATQPTAA